MQVKECTQGKIIVEDLYFLKTITSLILKSDPKRPPEFFSSPLYRKWLQDRIPTKIPDYAGCRKL